MIHECSICHKKEEWNKNWMSWGSLLMEDDGLPLLLTCSDLCRKAVELLGGPHRALGAIWDAKKVVVFHNRSKYKDILCHTVASLK